MSVLEKGTCSSIHKLTKIKGEKVAKSDRGYVSES